MFRIATAIPTKTANVYTGVFLCTVPVSTHGTCQRPRIERYGDFPHVKDEDRDFHWLACRGAAKRGRDLRLQRTCCSPHSNGSQVCGSGGGEGISQRKEEEKKETEDRISGNETDSHSGMRGRREARWKRGGAWWKRGRGLVGSGRGLVRQRERHGEGKCGRKREDCGDRSGPFCPG